MFATCDLGQLEEMHSKGFQISRTCMQLSAVCLHFLGFLYKVSKVG